MIQPNNLIVTQYSNISRHRHYLTLWLPLLLALLLCKKPCHLLCCKGPIFPERKLRIVCALRRCSHFTPTLRSRTKYGRFWAVSCGPSATRRPKLVWCYSNNRRIKICCLVCNFTRYGEEWWRGGSPLVRTSRCGTNTPFAKVLSSLSAAPSESPRTKHSFKLFQSQCFNSKEVATQEKPHLGTSTNVHTISI